MVPAIPPKQTKKIMIKEFLTYQQTNKGLSPQTCEEYRKSLKKFVAFASSRQLSWSSITKHDISDYVSYLVECEYKPKTIKRLVEVVRLIFKYMQHQGMVSNNPAQYVETPKLRHKLPDASKTEVIEEYLGTTPKDRESYLVHVLVALMFDTGMRIGEVENLRGEDIDTANKRIHITNGKGEKERYVYYSDKYRHFIDVIANAKGFVFVDGQRQYRYLIYKHLGNEIHPHGIRHNFACRQLDKGLSLKTLSTLLGHSSIKTTEIYGQMSMNIIGKQYQAIN